MNLSHMQTSRTGGVGAQLDELEVLISRIGSKNKEQAFQLLSLMDMVDAQLKQAEQHGANVKAEAGQYESACAALRKQAAAFVRDAGGAAALRAEREERAPTEEAWWWRLDELAAQKRSDRLLRAVKWGAALAILIGVLIAAYMLFFAPSPAVMARYQAIDKSTMLAESGNYTEALAALQKGLDAAPDDPDLTLWMGVIYSMQGNTTQAALYYAKAQGLIPGQEDYYLRRGQDFIMLGENSRAEQDAQDAIKVNPKSGKGYYILGTAQENAGDSQSALKSYQTAVDLAEAEDDSNLVVEARVKLGYLLQGAGFGNPGAATPAGGASPTLEPYPASGATPTSVAYPSPSGAATP